MGLRRAAAGEVLVSSLQEGVGVGLFVEAPNQQAVRRVVRLKPGEELLRESGLACATQPHEREHTVRLLPELLQLLKLTLSAGKGRGGGKRVHDERRENWGSGFGRLRMGQLDKSLWAPMELVAERASIYNTA